MADMVKPASKSGDALPPSSIHDGIHAEAPSEGDTELLATLGYKQELRRHYSTMQIFAVAFSIMGLLPSIASTLSFSMPAGPVGMVWNLGWLAASVFIFIVSLAMVSSILCFGSVSIDPTGSFISVQQADMASAMPTAGGLYFWTHYYSAGKWKNPLSFVVGYSNTIGLIGGICSIDYGFANMLLSMISLARDGHWTASRPVIYGTYVGTVCAHGVIATFFGRVMPKIQSACIFLNVALVVATVIALPIGKHENSPPVNSGAYVFGHVENQTTWPTGWAFMLAWLSPIWTIGAFDSCVHMSEEATHATRAVPLGIIASSGLCGILGFVSLAVIAASMDKDINGILTSKFGQPMAQIYYDALGKHGALGFMAVVATVQFFMGLSIVLAASRQSWAFSRDGALPLSSFFRKVSQRRLTRYQPVRMVCGVIFVSIIIGLLSLIDDAASNALFSLAVAGNDLAWLTPILARLIWGQDLFVPGEFYTGKYLSKPIAWTAVVYLAYAIVLCMIPTGGPDPSPADMNYTVVINGALWGGAVLYYVLHARKTFNGPMTTAAPEEQGKLEAETESPEKSP
ncbi:GABA-specific permease [Penicillium hispanicum]|uniref:GABA-specific permease n=1 Tax=Penicillium hispanicum TaxID=1080232 RepID=UPI0025412E2A|nr:GABA-specific permease [Penicillium hispanicum]KAJ5574019.1 GABA-specific permease [Penicillium hispanicum]